MNMSSLGFATVLANLVPVHNAGSPDYWRELSEANRLIQNAFVSYERVRHAPFIFDDDDDETVAITLEIIRSIHDAYFMACYAVDRHPTALRILASRKITHIGGYRFAD